LENLFISPSLKRRIGERAMRDYRRGEHQNPPCSLNVSTTLRSKLSCEIEDYEQKARVRNFKEELQWHF